MRAFEFIKENEIIDEMPLPADWDEERFKLDPKEKQPGIHGREPQYPESSFNRIVKYAQHRAKMLGEGSSRTVVNIDFQGQPSALKIAMNRKGLGQNAAEVKILTNPIVSTLDIVIPLIDYDKNHKEPVWVQTAHARVVSQRELCDILGIERLVKLTTWAEMLNDTHDPDLIMEYVQKHLDANNEPPSKFKNLWEYVIGLAKLQGIDVNLNDFNWQDNWGIYNGKPIVIDLGYTNEVKKKYYHAF